MMLTWGQSGGILQERVNHRVAKLDKSCIICKLFTENEELAMSVQNVERDEDADILEGLLEAMRIGDEAAEARLWPKLRIPPHCLVALKKLHGADYIRQSNFNTERAVEKYGPDWLERDVGSSWPGYK